MAAADYPQEEFDDKFLTCQICLEIYDNPRVLPCLHTFCAECLENLRSENNQIICPLDRKNVTLGAEGVSGLPPNFYVNSLLDFRNLQTSKRGSVSCQMCESVASIEGTCGDCHLLICKHCICAHGNTPLLKDHYIIVLDDLKNPRSRSQYMYTKNCPKHTNQRLTFYCQPCTKLVCQFCTFIEHRPGRKHDPQEVSKVAQKFKAELQTLLAQTQATADTLKKTAGTVGDKITSITANCELQRKKIQEHFAQLRAKLDKAEREVKVKLNKMEQDQKEPLPKEKEGLEKTLRSTEEGLQFCADILARGNDVEILTLRPQLGGWLENLAQYQVQNTCRPLEYQVSFQPNTEILTCNTGTLSSVSTCKTNVLLTNLPVEGLPTTVNVKDAKKKLKRKAGEKLETEDEEKLKRKRRKKTKGETDMMIRKVLLVGDEYGTSKGGVSTMNLNVAQKLTAAGAQVYVTVLEASEQDEKDAERDGVILLKPRLDADSSAKPCLEWLTVYHSFHFPHIPSDICCIVGHVDVTSRAARKMKEGRFPHAKLAMFGHVAPEETEHYKSDEKALGAGRKEASIQDDLGKADVVFSVGACIQRHYDRFLHQHNVDHHIFLPEPSKVFIKAKISFGESRNIQKPERVILSIGRVRNVERLKGHDLAAGGVDKAALRLDHLYTLRLRVRGIDENDFKESKRILDEKLRSGRVKPTLLPYGTQEEIRRDMENCHLVLMPSRAEPFGLVGLEAIAAGVPVLISEHSGLAELIEELSDRLGQPKFRHCIVKMTRDTATDADEEKWAERIEDVIKNARSEFAEARAFKEKLLASKYWEESQQKFIQACGITNGQ